MPTPLDAMLAINGVSQVLDGLVLVPKEAIVEVQMAPLKKESTDLGHLPPRKNVPRRLNFDHDQGGSMHQNTNEKPRDRVARRSARGAYFANPRPKQPTPHPMAPSTSKMAPSDPHVLKKPVKFPAKPRSMRSKGELRSWLGERKDEFKAKAINKKVQPHQRHVVRNFQPRTEVDVVINSVDASEDGEVK
ncbi:DNA polymerase sigma (ISS) [Corchorus olitorius]|uniref:DNA polymerase sigma (ISS) n=1 Tax=Corchorus olitorius TaxID=93759 RepID=A0A1R3FUI0_9ROSI|nr:DNA polymerase sigma (ISS) [Corchorus olitorius]